MSTVRTWADGFGRWYAEVPANHPAPLDAAERAITRELAERGALGKGYRVPVDPAPEYGPNVYREAD